MKYIGGLVLTFVVYILATKLYRKTKITFLHPVLVSVTFLIILLLSLDIEYESYNFSSQLLTRILDPVVVCLGIPLYKNREKMKALFIPIIFGVFTGIVTAVVTVYTLGRIFDWGSAFVNSLYAKSITTPLAIQVTNLLKGDQSITIIAVILTGIIGATIAPYVMKVGCVKNETAIGIGIGTASHGIGTSKAVEMGEEVGAASGIAMGLTGVLTVFFASVLSFLF